MDAAAKLGRNPVSKHHMPPEYGDEQADAERDCRTRLTRPNPQARTGTGKNAFSLFSWPRRAGLATLSDWSLPLLYVMTIHEYCIFIPDIFDEYEVPVAPVAQRYLVTLRHVGT